MAQIAPFCGIRYNTAKAGDISKLVSPPYDVISPADRKYYHKISPYNFVRLVLGEEFESDSDSNNRFTRARDYLNEWLGSGVMASDPNPALYLYEQIFSDGGRLRHVRGLICAVKICEYDEKIILPHENTLARPKGALAELIKQTEANLDCVYGVYADQDHAIDVLMDRISENEPTTAVTDKDEVNHKLWLIDDQADVTEITRFFEDKQIAIADGHHRYETALAYRNEMAAHGTPEQISGSQYAIMTLANVFQEDMTIYPTHRMIHDLGDDALASLSEQASELFEIECSSKESLISDMAARNAIGYYSRNAVFTLKPKAAVNDKLSGSQASKSLELNILHSLILEDILGIDQEKLKNQSNVIYTRSSEEAMQEVDCGSMQAAFLLNHIAVKSVLDIAAAGEKMPQKATYFYPKLLSGLVLRRTRS